MNDEDLRRAVHETLSALGIDAKEPQELQADFLFLRKQRKGSEELSKWVRRSILTAALGGLCYALWEGLRQAVKIQ